MASYGNPVLALPCHAGTSLSQQSPTLTAASHTWPENRMANRVPTALMAKGSAHSWPGGADHADAASEGLSHVQRFCPIWPSPSPRYQITGEGWRRLSCQPCRGHESPVGSLLGGSGSCQEPVPKDRKDIKDEPNRHSQSCWPQVQLQSKPSIHSLFSLAVLQCPYSFVSPKC